MARKVAKAAEEPRESEKAGDSSNGALDRVASPEAGPQDELTIEQLAAETGMTVRNIRAHQSRGLLPPPTIRGRTGFYGDEHVARLELIAEMQGDGFNLKAIERLLSGAGTATGQELLGFKRALTTPFEHESPELIGEGDLVARFGGDLDTKALAKAIKLDLLVPLGEGRYEVPSPVLLDAGEELVRLGVPREAMLRVLEQIIRNSDGVADVFVKLFLDQVWRPFDGAGRPDERLPEVRQALERLRPIASDALLAVFQRRMTRAVEQAFGRALERGR
jgi:DNA-binding transcriptional MerR regulator